MKYLVGIIVVLMCTNYTYCAEPITELESFPTLTEFQNYEDSDAWFYGKMLEYYKISAMYSAQVKYLGAEPIAQIMIPSIDDLESVEFKILKKYYNIAQKLKDQITALPDGEGSQKIKELRDKIIALEKKTTSLEDENFRNSINGSNADYYKNRYSSLMLQIDSLKVQFDKKLEENQKSALELYKSILLSDGHQYPIFSLSLFGTQHNFETNNIQEYLSPGIGINVNPGKLFGFGRILDFWTDYSYLINDVTANNGMTISSKINRFSFGVSANIALDELMKIEDFNANFKIGFGYFHSISETANTGFDNHTAFGNILKFELSVRNFSKYFPFEVFGDFNFNKFNKKLVLLGDNQYLIDKSWVTNFSIGLKFPLWQSSIEMP